MRTRCGCWAVAGSAQQTAMNAQANATRAKRRQPVFDSFVN
jgi:hypothetical protein